MTADKRDKGKEEGTFKAHVERPRPGRSRKDLGPSEHEERYIQQREAQLLEEGRKREAAEAEKREAERLKEVHFMHCPKCGRGLKTIGREGLQLDFCEGCEGIWFDKGELETLINMEIEHRAGFFNRLRHIFTGKR